MKLFTNRKTILPKQIRPDYDSIAAMEKEFRMDDQGFNERYDEMLIEHFKKEWCENSWSDSPEILMDKLHDIWGELTTNKYRDIIDAIEYEVYKERYPDDDDFREDCENLRARMIMRGKLAMGN